MDPAKAFTIEVDDNHKNGQIFLSKDLSPMDVEAQEAAKILVEVIEFWADEIQNRDLWLFHLYSNRPKLDEMSKLGFWAEYDNADRQLVVLLFGSVEAFVRLPFVKQENYNGKDTQFVFGDLKCFAEGGLEGLERKRAEIARIQAEQQAEERRIRKEKHDALKAQWQEKLQSLTPELRAHFEDLETQGDLKIEGDNIAVWVDSRSEYGSSGGIGYWSQCHVLFGRQKQMQEWQWRDRYSASKDRPSLAVHGIGEVKVEERDGKVCVTVELLNRNHLPRQTTFYFESVAEEKESVPQLSIEEQDAFTSKVRAEIERILAEKTALWEKTSTMFTERGEARYFQPRIKDVKGLKAFGINAFVIESQIDHSGTDRQMRFELFVIRHGDDSATLRAESHGYDKREGGAFLTVIDMTTTEVVISTNRGKETISF